MKYVLTLFLLCPSALLAIDSGDGSDGVCNITGGVDTQITSARRTYQCSSLNIDANLNDFKGGGAASNGSPLIIKVQGNVTIAAGVTVDFSGANGGDGSTASTVTGGSAGAGGFAGGSSTAGNGSNGNGSGAGTGGTLAPKSGPPSSYGGGGGGGSYKTVSATQPLDGDDNGSSIPAGANGSVYGVESAFDSSFVGGSGGAAGGSGTDSGSTPWFGSAGGGGGGALRIIAGGDITVDGTIVSNGGNGGGSGATTSSGGGGGASGGAVWLQAGGDLTVSASGSITATGGTGGQNDSGFAGFGGDGGDGRIRLDDADGVVTITGTVTPAPYSTSFTPTPITNGTSAVSRQYSSSVSCAKVALDENQPSFLINLIAGFLLVGLVHLSFSRKSNV